MIKGYLGQYGIINEYLVNERSDSIAVRDCTYQKESHIIVARNILDKEILTLKVYSYPELRSNKYQACTCDNINI